MIQPPPPVAFVGVREQVNGDGSSDGSSIATITASIVFRLDAPAACASPSSRSSSPGLPPDTLVVAGAVDVFFAHSRVLMRSLYFAAHAQFHQSHSNSFADSNESNNRHLSVVRIKPPAPRQFRVILDCIYADYSCAEDAAAVLSPDNFVGVYLNAQFTLADVLQDACCIWFARNWRSVISRDTFRWHTLDAPALLVLMRTPALTVTTTAAETLSILLSWARGVDWSRPAWSRDFRAVVRELVNCDEIAARELATLACDFGDPLALAIGVDCVIRLARPRTASAYLRSRVMTLRRAACDLILAFARRLEALRRLRTDHSRGTSLPSISLDLIFLPRFPCRPPHFLAVRL